MARTRLIPEQIINKLRAIEVHTHSEGIHRSGGASSLTNLCWAASADLRLPSSRLSAAAWLAGSGLGDFGWLFFCFAILDLAHDGQDPVNGRLYLGLQQRGRHLRQPVTHHLDGQVGEPVTHELAHLCSALLNVVGVHQLATGLRDVQLVLAGQRVLFTQPRLG
jgi:hypothetical protein